MILANRLFERQPPDREAKSLYIFCEGKKREKDYFDFFREKDSRINLVIYELDSEEDNSPLGLLSIAKKCILVSEDNPNPRYVCQPNDEVWIVFDTDPDKDKSREGQINGIKEECERLGWFMTESNPCFEVWLFFHLHTGCKPFEHDERCSAWKKKVNLGIKGGFDSRRHPIFIEEAIMNSQSNYNTGKDARPLKGSTQTHNLANSIFMIMKAKIRAAKMSLGQNPLPKS